MPSEQLTNTWTPVHLLGADRNSRWLVVCDHASNHVPPWIEGQSLGLSDKDMMRHIAFDIGAAGTAIRLANRLNAPAVLSNYSRLVIDPNRGVDDPTLIRRLYDETIVPANRHVSAQDAEHRIEACYRPYHELIATLAARRDDTAIVSVHTFTAQLRHKSPRPWHVGLLFAEDTRLSFPLADLLRNEDGLVVGLNEPYSGYLAGDTIDQHAIRHGRHNTLVEIRNDLVSDEAGQIEWADRLGKILPDALSLAVAREGE
ncbi:MAG: N-formylglutamate amidohydrolase [Pseudomonadota bacterium]